jgi:hypothetical protein
MDEAVGKGILAGLLLELGDQDGEIEGIDRQRAPEQQGVAADRRRALALLGDHPLEDAGDLGLDVDRGGARLARGGASRGDGRAHASAVLLRWVETAAGD